MILYFRGYSRGFVSIGFKGFDNNALICVDADLCGYIERFVDNFFGAEIGIFQQCLRGRLGIGRFGSPAAPFMAFTARGPPGGGTSAAAS